MSDKLLHFLCSCGIALVLYPIIGWWSIGAAVAAGVGKELYDLHDYGLFSWWDIAADLAGVLASVPIILLLKTIIP